MNLASLNDYLDSIPEPSTQELVLEERDPETAAVLAEWRQACALQRALAAHKRGDAVEYEAALQEAGI